MNDDLCAKFETNILKGEYTVNANMIQANVNYHKYFTVTAYSKPN